MKNKNELKLKENRFLIKIIVIEIIFLAMFVFIALNLSRINIFNSLIGSRSIVFKYIFVIFFFVAIDFVIFFYLILIIKAFDGIYFHKEWLKSTYRLYRKYDIFMFIFKVFSIIIFFLIYLVTPCSVYGDSMKPTFETSDYVLTFNIYPSPQKQDVVVFDAKDYTTSEAYFIKRVIATPGDVLNYQSTTNTLYINDEKITDFGSTFYRNIRLSVDYNLGQLKELSYVLYNNEYKLLENLYDSLPQKNYFVMPEGKYLVLGDNRSNSQDSRYFGLIDKEAIYGKVFLRFYPFSKFAFFS